MTSTAVPFELAWRGRDTWRGRWVEERLFVAVLGTEEAPSAPLMETLRNTVARWPQLRQAVAGFVRALAADHHVPLVPPTLGGFAAGSCGFEGELVFQSIAVTTSDAPQRVVVTLYTGYPDGYATFEVTLDGSTATTIRAFTS